MKAITYQKYGSPDILQLEEVAKPTPGDKDVLIKIRAAAVTSVDMTARKGSPFVARLGFGILKPKHHILGTEFAGEIEAVGKDVTRFKPGDAVFAASGIHFGAHAEYICLPEDGAVAIKPTNVSFEEAAAICEGGLTALPFLRDEAKLQPGQRILINGASGSVGMAAVQLAKYFGAEVTGVCSTRNVELLKSLGADQVIDYTQEDFTKNSETYDIIFDAVGKSSFAQSKGALKEGGIYLSTVLSLDILFQMMRTSKSSGKKAVIAFTGLRQPQDKANDLDFLRELAEAGRIKPFIDRRYRLEEMTEAHRYVDTGRKRGNVVMVMDGD